MTPGAEQLLFGGSLKNLEATDLGGIAIKEAEKGKVAPGRCK